MGSISTTVKLYSKVVAVGLQTTTGGAHVKMGDRGSTSAMSPSSLAKSMFTGVRNFGAWAL